MISAITKVQPSKPVQLPQYHLAGLPETLRRLLKKLLSSPNGLPGMGGLETHKPLKQTVSLG